MSATPRPWTVELDNDIDLHIIAGLDGDGSIGAVYDSAEDAQLIIRAVNAFAALLAVAKAVDKAGNEVESPLDWSDVGYVWEAMKTLDAAHPGWREWA